MTELKRCPFCNGEKTPRLQENKEKNRIFCLNCRCGTDWRDSKESVICTWNNRAKNDIKILKPCPFCGSQEVGLHYEFEYDCEFITCLKCYSSGPQRERGEEEAINVWNRRICKC